MLAAADAARVAADAGRVMASPLARRLAREQGIDLATVTGTGPGGRVVEADINAAVASLAAAPPAPEAAPAPAPAEGAERADLSRMRQAIARVTSDSKREAPALLCGRRHRHDCSHGAAAGCQRRTAAAQPGERQRPDREGFSTCHRQAPEVQLVLPWRPPADEPVDQCWDRHRSGVRTDRSRHSGVRKQGAWPRLRRPAAIWSTARTTGPFRRKSTPGRPIA